MTTQPSPEAGREASPIPYATPMPEKKSEHVTQTLGLIVFFQAAASVGIFLFAGTSWPAAVAVIALAATVIAFGHFLTRRPL